jgi:hypothetical protein
MLQWSLPNANALVTTFAEESSRASCDVGIVLNCGSAIDSISCHEKCQSAINDTHVGHLCYTFVESVPEDVLAYVMMPYCTFKDKMLMLKTCRQIKTAIMMKRIDIVETIKMSNVIEVEQLPGLMTRVLVQNIYQ